MSMADAIDAGHRQPCPTCGYDGGCPASHWIDNRGTVEELRPRCDTCGGTGWIAVPVTNGFATEPCPACGPALGSAAKPPTCEASDYGVAKCGEPAAWQHGHGGAKPIPTCDLHHCDGCVPLAPEAPHGR